MKLVLAILALILIGCGDETAVVAIPGEGVIVPPPGQQIIAIVDPCGDFVGGPDEIIVQLTNGEWMAWYQNIGLVLLDDGNYVTTDGQACDFSIVNGEYVE